MASLGTFGSAMREYAPADADPDTFEFCGETFTVCGEIPSMVELTMSAALAGKVPGIDGDAALYTALRYALTVPEREADGEKTPADTSEWDRFYRLAVDRNIDGQWLTAIALRIMGAQLGRPTEQQPTSSPGPLPTSTNSSTSASDSPASPGLRPVDEVLGG